MRAYRPGVITWLLLGILTADACGQDPLPLGQVFLGASHFWGTAATSDIHCIPYPCEIITDRQHRHSYRAGGVDLSFAGPINRFSGIEFDFTCCTKSGSLNTPQTLFTLGPYFSFPLAGRVSPFVHGLIGIANGRQATVDQHSTWRPGFASLIGFGVDVKIDRRLKLRAQADFLRESFRDDVQHNGRLSFGPVFQFGSQRKTCYIQSDSK